MLTSSAQLCNLSALNSRIASEKMDRAGNDNPPNTVTLLTEAESLLTLALAQVRTARWGVTRRSPSFDENDLSIVISDEIRNINSLTDSRIIPAQF